MQKVFHPNCFIFVQNYMLCKGKSQVYNKENTRLFHASQKNERNIATWICLHLLFSEIVCQQTN
jgi:hypothetical protein